MLTTTLTVKRFHYPSHRAHTFLAATWPLCLRCYCLRAQVMRDRLRFALYNCIAIDGDQQDFVNRGVWTGAAGGKQEETGTGSASDEHSSQDGNDDDHGLAEQLFWGDSGLEAPENFDFLDLLQRMGGMYPGDGFQ